MVLLPLPLSWWEAQRWDMVVAVAVDHTANSVCLDADPNLSWRCPGRISESLRELGVAEEKG